jgi:hypothetical protein
LVLIHRCHFRDDLVMSCSDELVNNGIVEHEQVKYLLESFAHVSVRVLLLDLCLKTSHAFFTEPFG